MKAYVFIGPSLGAEDAKRIWSEINCLPPARQGDVYRVASRLEPDAIGIVDGFFSHVPAVWHKEILHALAAGIAVYGGASMGALRAAELAQFGMVGVGEIFEAYHSGVLAPYDREAFENDDEVAVLHGPPETGFLSVSEALVNIRVTLARAAAEGVIAPATRDHLVATGKSIFYQERSYEAIFAAADVASSDVERLRHWLPEGRIDQKRADAIKVIHALEDDQLERRCPPFTLAETTLWQVCKAAIDDEGVPQAPELDELRMLGEPYLAARGRALGRLINPDGPGVIEPGEQEAEPMGSSALMTRARACAHERLAEELPLALVERHMLHELRRTGEAVGLARRARSKSQLLAQLDETNWPRTDDLLHWYFDRLGQSVPSDLDCYARQLDFQTMERFLHAVAAEYVFIRGQDIQDTSMNCER